VRKHYLRKHLYLFLQQVKLARLEDYGLSNYRKPRRNPVQQFSESGNGYGRRGAAKKLCEKLVLYAGWKWRE